MISRTSHSLFRFLPHTLSLGLLALTCSSCKEAKNEQKIEQKTEVAAPQQTTGRIAVRDGKFVQKSSGEAFRPYGINYFHWVDQVGHGALSPISYNETYINDMMRDVSGMGMNTIRTFLTNTGGGNGIVVDPKSSELNPAYLKNIIHFLKTAQSHDLKVIFTWDTWSPEVIAWKEKPLKDEATYGLVMNSTVNFKSNGLRLVPQAIRTKANAITTIINAIKAADPNLLPVVLAWEIENEAHFSLHQEPFLSRAKDFAFGGQVFDLSTDEGAQALMDKAAQSWANAIATAIHEADPEALASASLFTYAAVGRKGPGTWSKDETKDERVPARPMALLNSKLDFIDLHVYAGKSGSETITQHLAHDLASSEIDTLKSEAKRLGKPILIGECGVRAGLTRRGPVWTDLHHDVGVELLKEFHKGLATYSFDGMLHWHYGNKVSGLGDEFPALKLFPQYGEALSISR